MVENAEQKQKEEKKTSKKGQRKQKKYHTSREKLEMDLRKKKLKSAFCNL